MTKVRYAARSEEELRNREVEATSVGVWARTLVATYRTDPEVAASVLPPPLEPTGDPLVKVTIATVTVQGLPTFGAGSFSVQARHEGTVGFYALFMPMTTEQSVIGGRETFGEPKKIGEVTLSLDGKTVEGRIARMGTTVIEISGQRAGPADIPETETRTDFYFKALPAPDGKGFDWDPSLVYCYRTDTTRDAEEIRGTLTLRESRFDPVADLPVRSLDRVVLADRRSVQRGEIVGSVPAECLRPYLHQRYDDLSPVGQD